jgi:Protein of unknown function (DUF2804)
MQGLPLRGPGTRDLDLPLPPDRMPLVRDRRPLKRWRYVGAFSPELMLCVGMASLGPLTQRWWAIAEPNGRLSGRTGRLGQDVTLETGRVDVRARGVRIELELDEGDGVEVVSPSGRSWIWTRKQANVPVQGVVAFDGRERRIDCEAVVDDSAGYHERHTCWRWSAGVGRGEHGERVGWNLVRGIHDALLASERTVWIDDQPREVGPVDFAPDLSRVAGLRFEAWCVREEHTNWGLFRSDYRQPFGAFGGVLPGGIRLAHGFGVMEEHDVRW